jgi:probable rRNA maturation factor
MKDSLPRIYMGIQYIPATLQCTLSRVLLEKYTRQTVRATLHHVSLKGSYAINVLITDNITIQKLNHDFRGKNMPTDVLSFPDLYYPLIQPIDEVTWKASIIDTGMEIRENTARKIYIGDIAISWETIVRQAKNAGHSALKEYLYLVSHGMLHLIGYDDQTQSGYEAMTGIQNGVLALFPSLKY